MAGALGLNAAITVVVYVYCQLVDRLAELRMFMEANRLRFYVCIVLHLASWGMLLRRRRQREQGLDWLKLGLLNIFAMSHIYMQGQMAELNEPVKILIYSALTAVDACVMFVNALLSHEVSVGGVTLRCLASKTMFAVSLAIFYDDRVRFVVTSFFLTTLLSQLPLALTIARLLSDTEENPIEAGWIDLYVTLFLDLKFIIKASLGLPTKRAKTH